MHLTKKWNRIEKGIGILEVVFGVTIILFYNISWVITINQSIEEGITTWDEVSITQIFGGGSILLCLCTFSILSGILLLKSLKKGWVTSILNWIFLSGFLIQIAFEVYKEEVYLYGRANEEFIYFNGILSLLFLSIPFILIQKPFREKYLKNPKN